MKRTGLLLALLSLWAVAPATAAEKAPPAPSAKDKCPVCGMFVAKYPGWTAMIVLPGCARVYFDGPKDLFTYYLNPANTTRQGSGPTLPHSPVKDYYSLAAIDGKRAFYVIGSNVLGPMGKELIPFARKSDAEGFLDGPPGEGHPPLRRGHAGNAEGHPLAIEVIPVAQIHRIHTRHVGQRHDPAGCSFSTHGSGAGTMPVWWRPTVNW